MKKIYSKKLYYNINMSQNQFIEILNKHTKTTDYKSDSDEYDFRGVIYDDAFEIQADPHSRRELFNPILYGKLSKNLEMTQLSIKMKCKKFDMFFIALWCVICALFSLIIYDKSLENENLKVFVFILPGILLIAVNIFFALFAKINFRDAQEKIENILHYE